MSDLFLKPAKPGLIVRDPVTMEPLSAEGEAKPRNSHWKRRLKDGDVIETVPKSQTAGPKAARKEQGEK